MSDQDEYIKDVATLLGEWSKLEGEHGKAAMELCAELKAASEPDLGMLEALRARHFNVRDAASMLLYTSDIWDEDLAIAKQRALDLKYKV
jgi:hypothetical protein